jgi:PAT family acetyl-CoA transporter-like MFS transporter 1
MFSFWNSKLEKTRIYLFQGFLVFWGVIFAISTTFVALFKHETDETYDLNEPHFGLIETYKILIKVLRLPSVRSVALVLLTVKV